MTDLYLRSQSKEMTKLFIILCVKSLFLRIIPVLLSFREALRPIKEENVPAVLCSVFRCSVTQNSGREREGTENRGQWAPVSSIRAPASSTVQ